MSDKTAMENLVAQVDMTPELSDDKTALFAIVALEIATGSAEVLRLAGLMGLSTGMYSLLKAAYLLGVKDGKAQGGLTLFVAPESDVQEEL